MVLQEIDSYVELHILYSARYIIILLILYINILIGSLPDKKKKRVVTAICFFLTGHSHVVADCLLCQNFYEFGE